MTAPAPGDAPVLDPIEAALDADDIERAGALLDALDPAVGATARARYLEGRRRLARRQPRRAAHALADAVRLEPDNPGAWREYGRALNNLQRPAEAERALRRAVTLDDGHADTWHHLGHVCKRLGRPAEARAALERCLALSPGHARALTTLGLVAMDGDARDAAAHFEAAHAAAPDDPGILVFLGAARHKAGDRAAALAAYERALELDPSRADAWGNYGITLQDADRLDEAVDAYRRATALEPGDFASSNRLADALIARGDPDGALAETDACLARDPGNPGALAARVVALTRRGDRDAAMALEDVDRLVASVDLAPPEGFSDLAAFNAALAAHVLAHPTLTWEPVGHATRRGSHTRDLLDDTPGPVAGLASAIRTAVGGYLKGLDLLPGHPFPGRLPRELHLTMWAVVMASEGHQLPHIHPAALVSGVYYVQLPAVVHRGEGAQAGWIAFGRPPDELAGDDPPPARVLQPAEGRLFLFPSYFYHHTVPFESDQRRICIAFDVLRGP